MPKQKLPDGSGWIAKYEDDKCDWKEKMGIEFPGTLISADKCEEFKQSFPCVGPHQYTGPHTDTCLKSLWKKAKCTGDITERGSGNDFKKWNSKGYGFVQDDMRDLVYISQNSKDYEKAEAASKKCLGVSVDACASRFKPLNKVCGEKMFLEAGCLDKGELNPAKMSKWNDSNWVSDQYINLFGKNTTAQSYKNSIIDLKRKARKDIIDSQQSLNKGGWKVFDSAVQNNMACFGKKPNIPWKKPCWKDFIIIMSNSGIAVENPTTGNLSFSKAPQNIKSLLPLTNVSKNNWKAQYAFVGEYELTHNTYNKPYFPFWAFVSDHFLAAAAAAARQSPCHLGRMGCCPS